jgi:hypothetical protein
LGGGAWDGEGLGLVLGVSQLICLLAVDQVGGRGRVGTYTHGEDGSGESGELHVERAAASGW